MKVILREDIDDVGNIGDVLEVARGFARNYLIPRNKAVEATSRSLKAVEHAKRVAPHAKIIMFARNPADRDLSHLIHIATDKVLGTPKLAAVMDAIALHLDLTGDRMEKRRQTRAHFKLNREDVRSMDLAFSIVYAAIGLQDDLFNATTCRTKGKIFSHKCRNQRWYSRFCLEAESSQGSYKSAC